MRIGIKVSTRRFVLLDTDEIYFLESDHHDWNDPDRGAYELRVVNRLFGEQSHSFEEEYLRFVRERCITAGKISRFSSCPTSAVASSGSSDRG